MKIKGFHCPECGGTNCGYDANSVWSPAAGDWVLGHSYDNGWCNDCGDVEPEEYEITDAAELESIAKERAELKLHAVAPELLAAAKRAAIVLEGIAKIRSPGDALEQLERAIAAAELEA